MEIDVNSINNRKKVINYHKKKQDNKDNHVASKKNNVHTYNIKNNYSITKNDINLFKKINSHFIHLFSIDISDYLNINKINIKLSELKIEIDCKNIKNFKKPIVLNLIEINQCKNSSFIIFSSDFISMIIENLFGGNQLTISSYDYNKKITDIECNILQNITEIVIKAYKKSFESFFPMEIKYITHKIISDEDSISYFKIDTCFVTTFQMMIGSIKGIFSIFIPLIEVKKNLLNIKITEKLENYKNQEKKNILKNIHDLNVTITVKLTESIVYLSKVLQLKLGDIIPIKEPENGIVYINGCPILLGKYKIVDGRHALCVNTLIGSDIKS
ncbi:MAG TPA: FliM/FliN family flagellar motor switch protein [Buchnera sp. (in: enterobacteria)]|nr:FliM/FliN family flagellar motor switch protein [Buchnera sp. (in: enterobacteria)]